jgi:hypothetical protein
MAKNGFLNRLKQKVTTEKVSTEKKIDQKPPAPSKSADAIQEEPLVEYEETLYAQDASAPKQQPMIPTTMSSPIYRNVERIEEDIDTLSKRKKSRAPASYDDDISSKVDKALSKRPRVTHRKPANVIYVVSRPQPGQVRGDWAVRSHGKIFSHHRTKEVAIRKAREIARERDATVLIQRMDGTFSEGFKPRKK